MDVLELISDYREFTTSEEAETWGKAIYSDFVKMYDENMFFLKQHDILDEILCAAIECYCGYTYRDINKYLRTGEDKNSRQIYTRMADMISLSIVMAPAIPENIILYRMISDEVFLELQEKSKNSWMIEKGFLSASLVKAISEQEESYARHTVMLKLLVNKGTKGIYVSELAGRSEMEMLLLPNAFLQLVDDHQELHNGTRICLCRLDYF